jgi:hypothetical protein
MAVSQFTIYKSSDTGAPVLNLLTGSFINVLRGCLVDGYGDQSPAGWTMEYSSSNNLTPPTTSIGVFKQGIPTDSGNQYYLRIRNDGVGTGGMREAHVRGYKTMTNFASSSGSYAFPASASGTREAGHLIMRLSSRVRFDSTPINWILAADNRTFYFFSQTSSFYYGMGFGDFYSNLDNDQNRCMIIANEGEEIVGLFDSISRPFSSITWTRGHYLCGSVNKIGSSAAFGKTIAAYQWDRGITGTLVYPDPINGFLYLSELNVISYEKENALRGKLRGLWASCHTGSSFLQGISDGDTFSGSIGGNLDGRIFMVIQPGPYAGSFILETSNTVETND